jgi:hypothetical protein
MGRDYYFTRGNHDSFSAPDGGLRVAPGKEWDEIVLESDTTLAVELVNSVFG